MRLLTLGALDLQNAEGAALPAVLAQPRRAALLVYLALAKPLGSQPRDTLVTLFWPEMDSEHARNALSQAVHFLRRSLGPDAIVSGNGDALSLRWADVWCDAVAFEETLDEGRTAAAIEIYRGDLLEGFHIAGASEFERWLESERARLAGRYARAVESFASEREAANDFDQAVTLWKRLAARDRYNSRVALRLMRALTSAGDPAGAVQHARIHETLLREELGIAPDAEIAALVEQLRSGSPPRSQGLAEHQRAPAPEELVLSRQASKAETSSTRRPAAHLRPRRSHIAIASLGLIAILLAALGSTIFRNRGTDQPPIRSIAVLPFEDLSGDTLQPFVDGMHDELINEVARYPDIRVSSRWSALQYKGTTLPPPEVARLLHVEGLVVGTLLREGGRIRVNVQLLHGSSGRQLWVNSYTRDLRDVLDLQHEIAEDIAREVHVAAAPAE